VSSTKKRISVAVEPGAKQPRNVENPESSSAKKPVWKFSAMARDGGSWCWDGHPGETWELVTEFLSTLEGQTWGELSHSGKHTTATGIPVESLPKASQARMMEHVNLRDIPETLWELHMGGLPRVWGRRRQEVFEMMWWDPDHEVCPSKKRRT
jgi:hypothetical protein